MEVSSDSGHGLFAQCTSDLWSDPNRFSMCCERSTLACVGCDDGSTTPHPKYGFLKNFGIGFDAHQIDPELRQQLKIKKNKPTRARAYAGVNNRLKRV